MRRRKNFSITLELEKRHVTIDNRNPYELSKPIPATKSKRHVTIIVAMAVTVFVTVTVTVAMPVTVFVTVTVAVTVTIFVTVMIDIRLTVV